MGRKKKATAAKTCSLSCDVGTYSKIEALKKQGFTTSTILKGGVGKMFEEFNSKKEKEEPLIGVAAVPVAPIADERALRELETRLESCIKAENRNLISGFKEAFNRLKETLAHIEALASKPSYDIAAIQDVVSRSIAVQIKPITAQLEPVRKASEYITGGDVCRWCFKGRRKWIWVAVGGISTLTWIFFKKEVLTIIYNMVKKALLPLLQ